MKKIKDILFEPDEYDGITWFDVICACVFSSSFIALMVFLIKNFC
jgi:hypothetical protein